MGHVTDRLDVINKSLLSLGSQTLTMAQLTGSQTDLGKLMDNLLEDITGEIAGSHDWQTVTKLSHLSTAVDNTSNEDFEFNQYFTMPTDYARLVGVPYLEDAPARTTHVHCPDYKIANNRFYTNASYVDFYYVFFTYRDDDFWTALMKDAKLKSTVISRLLADSTYALKQSSSQARLNETKAAISRKRNMVGEASSRTSKQNQQSRAMQVRYRGS